MAIGPGKYDELCSYVMKEAGALAVIVIVIEGKHGSGFSVQAPLEIQEALPSILRVAANNIEEDRNTISKN